MHCRTVTACSFVREFIAKNGHSGTQMLITPKGRQLFQAELAEIIG